MGDDRYGVDLAPSKFHLREMVQRFNSLPRPKEVPSGGAYSEWTISIKECCITDEEGPGAKARMQRVIFLATPGGSYGLSSHVLGPATSGKQEIEIIAYHLLALFTGYDTSPMGSIKTQYAPYKWMFEYEEVGRQVCEKLRELGVKNEDLLEMPLPTAKERHRAERHWIWYRAHAHEEWLRYKMNGVRIFHRECYNVGTHQ